VLASLSAAACRPAWTAAAALGGGRAVSPEARAARESGPARTPANPSSPGAAPAAADTAPDGPPLIGGEAGSGLAAEGEEPTSGSSAQADPLVSNGLGSPTCHGALAGELAQASRRNCQTSGFVAAPAPTGDYGIDVHIDTGLLGLGSGALASAVQDLIVTPLWMALVWAVHALVVMLEWCFNLDLLDGSTTLGLGGSLRAMQASFTEPWLPIALACASMLALYHGLIRRRVAQTLGEALLMGAMMIAGLWLIVDPAGTIGALGQWADQASLGTLAVTAHGTPSAPGGALGSSLGSLYATAIEAPWCYLEFGDVAWCREPARLDPRLRAAALKIAAEETAQTKCQPGGEALGSCVLVTGAQASALEHSAELLRDARTNGAIFLALPANGVARNSINEQGSLLRTLCQSSEATSCHGATAAQAEFRTASGTMARLGGLLLIAAGLLGMLLLLGFVAVRLLLAAIFSLLCLLLAPAMVVVPAFGEGGRSLFRRWAGQLLGAVVSKLVFSFVLGVVLSLIAILSGLVALGWWTQWLLMSAFWWSAYLRRHQTLAAAGAGFAAQRSTGERGVRRSALPSASELLRMPRQGIAAARWTSERFSKRAPEIERRRRAQAARTLARAGTDEQVERTLEHEYSDARRRSEQAPAIQRELAAKRAQLARIGSARAQALERGDARRASELGERGARVRTELERREQALHAAQAIVREGERARRRTGDLHTPERRAAHGRFLDAQAALSANPSAQPGKRRDYAALAGLAGLGRAEYQQLDPARQRAARAEIDRELALRSELRQTASTFAAGAQTLPLGRREQRRADGQFQGAVHQRMAERGHRMPASRRPRSEIERWREAARAERPTPGAAPKSSVMRDAHEVAARRKRQLGRDRP